MFLSSAKRAGARYAQRIAHTRGGGSPRIMSFWCDAFQLEDARQAHSFCGQLPSIDASYQGKKKEFPKRHFSSDSPLIQLVDLQEDDNPQGDSPEEERDLPLCIWQRKADALCDLKKYPANSFTDSEQLWLEAVDVIEQLSGIGSPESFQASQNLLRRLASDGTPVDNTLDSEVLNGVLRNAAGIIAFSTALGKRSRGRSKKMTQVIHDASKELLDAIRNIVMPNYTSFEILLLNEASMDFSQSLAEREERTRQLWKDLRKNYADDEVASHQLNECAENVLIQLNAHHGDLLKSMKMAKDLIERQNTHGATNLIKIRDESFMSILAEALSCPTKDQPEVTAFFTWAGEQYAGCDCPLEVKVESIYLFGIAAQIQSSSEDKPPLWLLQSIDWIGRQVKDCTPSRNDYNKAIKLWASAGQTSRAKGILDNMFKQWQNGSTAVFPTLESYNACLLQLLSDKSSSCSVAIDILTQMTNEAPAGLVPNRLTYKLVINCLYESEEAEAGAEAIRVIREMTNASKTEEYSKRSPTRYLYLDVIFCLEEHKESQRLEEFLEWMEKEWANGNGAAKLEASHFSTQMHLIARLGGPDVAEKGMSILDRLQRLGLVQEPAAKNFFLALIGGITDLDSPDAVPLFEKTLLAYQEAFPKHYAFTLSKKMYNRAMLHYAASGEAEKAESLMMTMHEMFVDLPGSTTERTAQDFNMVLEAWSNSAAPRAAERADAIVQHMHSIDGIKLSDSKPNIKSYENLLCCWKKSDLPEAKERQNEIKSELKKLRTN